MIFKIARTELRNLVYSPVAWFLTVVFLIMSGIFYTVNLKDFVVKIETIKELSSDYQGVDGSLTDVIYFASGFFSKVFENLYLFIPLLTMGVISREKTNGTIKLLYSSPVRVRDIVLGKYLAIFVYNLFLLGIVLLFIVTGIFAIESVDIGWLISAAIGFFLLISAYCALGIFMSSLTQYQIVSAVATFTVIFVLNFIGGLWQQYDFIRDLTTVLSMRGRTQIMLRGLVTTKDIAYFLLIVAMFLSFTILRLKFERILLPWYKKVGAYMGVFILALTLGYLTSRPGYIGYMDLTAQKKMTIDPRTQEIVRGLNEGPIEVTLYTNLFDPVVNTFLPHNRFEYVWMFWDKYVRFNKNFKFKYTLFYDQNESDSSLYKGMKEKNIESTAKGVAKFFDYPLRKFLPREEIRKIIDLKEEDYRSIIQLKYKDRSVFLRLYTDIKRWPDEEHVAAALNYLLTGKHINMCFISGHFERNPFARGDRGYRKLFSGKSERQALINHGYLIDTINIEYQNIPEDADIVVLADPRSELGAEAQKKIHDYLAKGGNMIILGEPGKQDILNPILNPLGVQLAPGTVVEVTDYDVPDKVMPYITQAATELDNHGTLLIQKRILEQRGDSLRVPFRKSAAVLASDSLFQVKHLLVTTPERKAWVKVGKLASDSAKPVFNHLEGDYRLDSVSGALSLERKLGDKIQRILVAGDADFLGNFGGEQDWFTLAGCSWVQNREYPILFPSRPNHDRDFKISTTTAKGLYLAYVWIIPGLILISGVVILIRRKRK